MVNVLDDRQESALQRLAKFGLRKSNWECIRTWQHALTIGYACVLGFDILGHFLNVPELKIATEGWVTLVVQVLAASLAFPIVAARTNNGRRILSSLFLVLVGVTDYDWFMMGAYPMNDALHLKSFVFERATLERRHLMSITKLFRKRLDNLSLRFNITLILLVPMLIAKMYFAVSLDYYTCNATDALRVTIILFCLFQAVISCARQENAVFDYLKAANFQDYFEIGVRDPEFNSTLHVKLTFYFSLACKAISMVYRVYSIIFYFVMSIVFGMVHVIFIFLTSALYHVTCRPTYENPTTVLETWPNDFLESWARIFFLRAHRISARGFQVQLKIGFIWTFVLLIQHLVPLYALNRLYPLVFSTNGTMVNTTPTNEVFTSCGSSYYDNIQYLFVGMKPDLRFLGKDQPLPLFDLLTEHARGLTTLLIITVVCQILNLLYLSANDQNDDRFPSFLAADIYCTVFMRRDWANVSRAEIERMIVLSLVDMKRFRRISRRSRCCRWYRPINSLEWRTYAVFQASKAPAVPDINFMRSNMLEDNPRREYFEPLVDRIYELETLESSTLKRMMYLFMDQFEEIMAKMTSWKLTETNRILNQTFVDSDD